MTGWQAGMIGWDTIPRRVRVVSDKLTAPSNATTTLNIAPYLAGDVLILVVMKYKVFSSVNAAVLGAGTTSIALNGIDTPATTGFTLAYETALHGSGAVSPFQAWRTEVWWARATGDWTDATFGDGGSIDYTFPDVTGDLYAAQMKQYSCKQIVATGSPIDVISSFTDGGGSTVTSGTCPGLVTSGGNDLVFAVVSNGETGQSGADENMDRAAWSNASLVGTQVESLSSVLPPPILVPFEASTSDGGWDKNCGVFTGSKPAAGTVPGTAFGFVNPAYYTAFSFGLLAA